MTGLAKDEFPAPLQDQISTEEALTDRDIARPADLIAARNLKKMELHRYQMARALKKLDRSHEHGSSPTETETPLEDVLNADEENWPPSDQQDIQTDVSSHQSQNASLAHKEHLIPLIQEHATIKALFWEAYLKQKKNMRSSAFMARSMMLNYHQKYFDLPFEKKLFNPLISTLNKSKNRGRSKSSRFKDVPQPCAPVRLVEWSLETLASYQTNGNFKNYSFIDPSAGHGRTLILASKWTFDEIIGYEVDRQKHKMAKVNLAQFPRSLMKQRDVTCQNKDPRLAVWPQNPLVIHFFNPQSRGWLKAIIQEIGRSFYANPRPIYINIIGLGQLDILANADFLRPFRPYVSKSIQFSLMSPYSIAFYRALPAQSDQTENHHSQMAD